MALPSPLYGFMLTVLSVTESTADSVALALSVDV